MFRLRQRSCPVCGSCDDHQERFPERIDARRIDGMSYASRKEPEFMSLRMVVCPDCDLLYAPRVPDAGFLHTAYAGTGYDSDLEARHAAASYAQALRSLLPVLPDRAAALEIGTGNGAFLAHLLAAGFADVRGVEPSIQAAAAAPAALQSLIQVASLDPADFPPAHFSLIVACQTLEHIDAPGRFLEAASTLLKPGGVIMIVSHNYRHWLMRALGARSPIIDIEHLQLFSPASMRAAFRHAGLVEAQVRSFRNGYPIHYWSRLLPLPRAPKRVLYALLREGWLAPLGQAVLSASVGNLLAWAVRPRDVLSETPAPSPELP